MRSGRDPKDDAARADRAAAHRRPAQIAAAGRRLLEYGEPFEIYPIDTGRLRRVVELVADKAGVGQESAAAARPGHRRASQLRELRRDRGRSRGRREGQAQRCRAVDTAIDCGFAANPERIRSQIEGAAVMGLSLARYGEISFKNGRVEQGNFNDFHGRPHRRIRRRSPMSTSSRAGIDVPSSGVGEPGVPPFAPALCNAIFAATGKRIRAAADRRPARGVRRACVRRRPSGHCLYRGTSGSKARGAVSGGAWRSSWACALP